jgi:hypothetical protein
MSDEVRLHVSIKTVEIVPHGLNRKIDQTPVGMNGGDKSGHTPRDKTTRKRCAEISAMLRS